MKTKHPSRPEEKITAPHLRVGEIGEDIAAKYLEKRGHTIVGRNYSRKWAEIDVVSRETTGKVHFVEVKAVSYETKETLERMVSRETWRPEEKVDERKLHQIHKAVQTWLSEHNYQGDFQIDVVAVQMVPREKIAVVSYLENVI